MAQVINKKSLAQQTAEALWALIIEGNEFHPGDRLPNEMELSSRFHVSRTTLREAIRTLSVHGIVEVRHGIGTFVAEQLPLPTDYGFHNLANLKIDARDLFEARLIFEPQVAALAVQRATENEMKMLLDIEKKIEDAHSRNIDVNDLDRQFHNALVKCAHNPFLEQIIAIINDAIKNLLMIIDFTEVQDMVANDHRYIMDFVSRRDPVGVESAMRIHILHCIQVLDSADTDCNKMNRAFL